MTEAELNAMTRADLDELAEENGLDPGDYNNKSEIVEALVPLVADEGDDDTDDLDEKIAEKKEQIAAKKRELKGNRQLDPMIVDPAAEQRERFDGTTSDASTRQEGVVARDVPPDPNDDPNKPSDAEDYDFPPGGDVDIATVEVIESEGESFVRPSIEDWVVLDGASESVPDALDGRRAVILDVRVRGEYAEDLIPAEDLPDVTLTVRTRDDYSATLYIPWDAVKELQKRGVSPMRT
jgi:hypothetical protein